MLLAKKCFTDQVDQGEAYKEQRFETPNRDRGRRKRKEKEMKMRAGF